MSRVDVCDCVRVTSASATGAANTDSATCSPSHTIVGQCFAPIVSSPEDQRGLPHSTSRRDRRRAPQKDHRALRGAATRGTQRMAAAYQGAGGTPRMSRAWRKRTRGTTDGAVGTLPAPDHPRDVRRVPRLSGPLCQRAEQDSVAAPNDAQHRRRPSSPGKRGSRCDYGRDHRCRGGSGPRHTGGWPAPQPRVHSVARTRATAARWRRLTTPRPATTEGVAG